MSPERGPGPPGAADACFAATPELPYRSEMLTPYFSVPEVAGLPVEIEGRTVQLWNVRVEGVASIEGHALRLQFHVRDRYDTRFG